MPISKRTFVQSLAAATAIATSAQAQAACYVTNRRQGSLPAKSYTCRLGERKELTATFMRLSDLSFDIARSVGRPDWLPASVENMTFLDNPTLDTLLELFSNFGFKFDYRWPKLTYDSRDGTFIERKFGKMYLHSDVVSIRTLGVWDGQIPQPVFPSPNDLRRIGPRRSWDHPPDFRFLRFAGRRDFEDLEAKATSYIELSDIGYVRNIPEAVNLSRYLNFFGNLALMRHIGAGSVRKFLPIFSSNQGGEGCGGPGPEYGIYYDPPALFFDIAVLDNTGPESIVIEDVVGQSTGAESLRPYNDAIATRTDRLARGPIRLRPGESAAMVQRLMFRTLEASGFPKAGAAPAEYGRSELPTGVLVDGNVTTFEGRSHVAMILTSDVAFNSCPFLEYLDSESQEWVSTGTILEKANGPDKHYTQDIAFNRLIRRFRIIEKEAEISTISKIGLHVRLLDETERTLYPRFEADGTVLASRLHYGDVLTFAFTLPTGVSPADVVSCRLSVSGFYEKVGQAQPA